MLALRRPPLAYLVAAAVFLSCSPTQPSDPTQPLASPLTSAPLVGAESRIDEPVYTEQSGEQSQPFIAPGGPGALVVWRDDSNPSFAVSERPVTFSRLDANGNLLDPLPIPITPPAADDFYPWLPLAVWNGDRALVFWANSVAGGLELQGSRLTSDGAVLDPGTLAHPGGIDIALGAGMRTPVAAVPFGSDFLVFWQENSEPRMGRVGRDGSVATLGGSAIALPADGVARTLVGAVAVTGGALVMVSENSLTKVMKVDATGAALSALSDAAGPASTFASGIASSGSDALVCWAQATATGQPVTVCGRRLGADAVWIDAAPFEVRAAGAAIGQVGAVWNGSGYVCTWTDAGTRVRAALRAIPASGAPVAAAVGPMALATAPVQSVQVVWTGSRYLAAMARSVYASVGEASLKDRADGVLARALGADLQPIGTDAIVVTTQPNQQLNFRAVGTPATAYVVWQDDRQRGNVDMYDSQDSDAYGARVTVDEGVLGQAAALLLTGADREYNPGVGWDGTQFTVAYISTNSTRQGARYLQRVSALGALAGSRIGPLKETYAGNEPLVVWNGQNFLVASLDTSGYAVVLYRVSAAGVQLDTQPVSVSASAKLSNLQAVAIGSAFVLIFQATPLDAFGTPTGEDNVQGLALNADGTLLTAAPTAIANSAGAQDVPAVATDGTSALVVWRDRGTAGPDIASARISATLARLDAADAVIAQATAPDTLGAPALAWTGTQYVAVWTRGSGGTITFAGCSLGADRRCAPGSEASVPSDIATSTPDAGAAGKGEMDDVRAPMLVWTDAGGVLFYRRLDTSPYVNRERVFARPILVGTAPPVVDGGVDASGPAPDSASPMGGTGGQATDGAVTATGGAVTATGGAAGQATSGAIGATDGAAGQAMGGAVGTTGGAGGRATGGVGGQATGGASGQATGDSGGTTGGSDGAAGGAAVDAGRPVIASASGCKCAMGRERRSSRPWWLLLPALVLLRRRRGRRRAR
jgi:hypothetical protein